MTTTQPWEIEFDSTFNGLYDPIVRESIRIKSFITSTRLSAYKEGQRDMREEVVKMAEGMKTHTHGDNESDWDRQYAHNTALTDLISEITK